MREIVNGRSKLGNQGLRRVMAVRTGCLRALCAQGPAAPSIAQCDSIVRAHINVPTLGSTRRPRAVGCFRRNAATLLDKEREEAHKEAATPGGELQ